MARPKQIDDEELLASLRATFLDLGPSASTQELASRAQVSEGTLFKRFGDKHRLFARAMRLPDLEECDWFRGMARRAGKLPIGDHLAEIAVGLASHLEELIPRMQMIFANGKLRPEHIAESMCGGDPPPLQVIRKVEALLARGIEAGQLRSGDARHLAYMFVGGIVERALVATHFPKRLPASDRDPVAFARRHAAAFASLLAASTGERQVPLVEAGE